MMDPKEELARMRAEMDQAREGMKEFAATLWGFHSDLLDEGFDEAQALRLTIAWMQGVQRGAAGDD